MNLISFMFPESNQKNGLILFYLFTSILVYLYTCVLAYLFTFNFSLYTLPMPRYFTLQEANETLNLIRPLMDEVQRIRQKILEKQPEAWPAIERSVGNGG